MRKLLLLFVLSLIAGTSLETVAQTNYDFSQMLREKLGRGLVGLRVNRGMVALSWRYLSSDSIDTKFHIYQGEKMVAATYKTSVRLTDYYYSKESTYRLVPVVGGVEQTDKAQEYTIPANSPSGYIEIPLTEVADTTIKSSTVTYSPTDASVGDVDGDGQFEIIFKWDPSNSKDNSQDGHTGDVLLDCYKLDGTHMWRINLGRNIRAGAHYTQFMVYDLDVDGKAEVVCKTADGTVDGIGNVIGDATKDYRNSSGYILSGPEYLTVFSGETGAALQTIDYNPQRGNLNDWGDTYGNRVDRFLACTAYLDGKRPSVVMCRGYYSGKSSGGRTVIDAYDWDGKELTSKWVFDTKAMKLGAYVGQGNHNLRVGDIDGDGCDEIVYGSMTVDHDGKAKYNTRLGHGDAIHMTVFNPASGAMAVWACHEDKVNGSTFRDAATGKIIKQVKSSDDVGRCMAADIDPNYPGVEMWSGRSGGILATDGRIASTSTSGVSMNMACWWDGTLLRNLQDGITITRYDYSAKNRATTLLTASGCASNNGTKSNPCLVADMFGDWREELLVRTSDNKQLRLYISTDSTVYRFHSFLEDPVYRSSVAYQNVAYNQPTHTGFYFGADLGKMVNVVAETGQIWTLDAGMEYDSYRWMLSDTLLLGTDRTVEVLAESIPEGSSAEVILYSVYRGYEFKESVTLTRPSSIGNVPRVEVRVPFVIDQTFEVELPVDKQACVEVFELNGVPVASVNTLGGSALFDATSWPNGLYLVKVTTVENTVTRKAMKR